MYINPSEAIETPALLIDLDAVRRNIDAMNAFLNGKPIKLRPHFKTAKIPEIARMQVAAGAKGITCATLSEAEVLADAGIDNILIANQVVAPAKINRVAHLAGRISHLVVAVDSVENVNELSNACSHAGTTLYAYVEIDVGLGRCGVRSYEEGLTVSRAVIDAPNLVFDGIQAYEGHIATKPELHIRSDGVKQLLLRVAGFKDYLENHGVTVNEVSGGSSGTYALTGGDDLFTELQAGTYIYMDGNYDKLGLPFEHALYVLGMVISKKPGIAVLDIGRKSIATDKGNPFVVGFEKNELKLTEEHCLLEDSENQLKVCDNVILIPSHCCTTINIYNIAYGIRNGVIERVFDVKGRGKSQ